MTTPGQPITKIINHSYIREMCHNQDIKISEEALTEIARHVYFLMKNLITDTKEMDKKTILRRFVEGRI